MRSVQHILCSVKNKKFKLSFHWDPPNADVKGWCLLFLHLFHGKQLDWSMSCMYVEISLMYLNLWCKGCNIYFLSSRTRNLSHHFLLILNADAKGWPPPSYSFSMGSNMIEVTIAWMLRYLWMFVNFVV